MHSVLDSAERSFASSADEKDPYKCPGCNYSFEATRLFLARFLHWTVSEDPWC